MVYCTQWTSLQLLSPQKQGTIHKLIKTCGEMNQQLIIIEWKYQAYGDLLLLT